MKSKSNIIYKGIDIYQGNDVNDWAKVAASGYKIAYIKATEGSTVTDSKYLEFAKKASEQGLGVGFYHYFWPYNDATNAVKQANYFYEAIKQFPYTCIPVLDTEVNNNMTSQTVSADMQNFINEFKRLSGQTIMIYADPSFIKEFLTQQFSKYPLWIANYGVAEPADTTVWNAWDAWQSTGTGKVDGINGIVDLDDFTDYVLLPGAPDPGVNYTVYPGESFFGPGKSNEYINLMGQKLIERTFGTHYVGGASPVWSEADMQNYSEWQYALGFKGSNANGIPGKKSWDILMSSVKITPAYPEDSFFKLNTVSAFAFICGKALVKAGCSDYKDGPSIIWQKADQNSYKLFQKKISDNTMDGNPDTQGWLRLQQYMNKY